MNKQTPLSTLALQCRDDTLLLPRHSSWIRILERLQKRTRRPSQSTSSIINRRRPAIHQLVRHVTRQAPDVPAPATVATSALLINVSPEASFASWLLSPCFYIFLI